MRNAPSNAYSISLQIRFCNRRQITSSWDWNNIGIKLETKHIIYQKLVSSM